MVKPIPENNGDTAKNVIMLSMGIDVSKGESMVCALNQFGKVVLTPRRYKHVKSALGSLVERLRSFGDNDIRIIMETRHKDYYGNHRNLQPACCQIL